MTRQSALFYSEKERFSGITIGKVLSIYPEANMVDVILFDGSIFKQVQVMVSTSSSRSGGVNLPLPKQNLINQAVNPLRSARQDESDVFVVVGFIGGEVIRPIALGFLFPENCELLCDRTQTGNQDGTQFLWKHESNVYVRIAKGEPGNRKDSNGNDIEAEDPVTPDLEISHPSGLFIKIGSYDTDKNPNEQLTSIKNYDAKIRAFNALSPVNKKVEPAPWIDLYHPSGTYLTVDKDGNVKIYVVGDVNHTVKGNVTEEIDGDVNRTIKGNVTEEIDGTLDKTIKGDVTEEIDGTLDKTIKKDVTETLEGKLSKNISGDLEETVGGDATRDVSGQETDTITGAWQRTSDASITDTAPSVDHE